MPYKPLTKKFFEKYITFVGWKLEKGAVDWNLFDAKGNFICSIIIAHGKKTKSEITAFSVHKIKSI